MAIDVTELAQVFDLFITKATASLKELQSDTQMEDEFLSSAISTTLIGAMDHSVKLYQIDKQITAEAANTQARIAAEAANTQANINAEEGVRAAQVALLGAQKSAEIVRKDVLYQQELGEKIKNGGVSISHTYDVDGNVLTTTYGTGTSKSIYEEQRDLFARQRVGFDDRKNTDKAKLAEELVSAIFLSGGTAPVESWIWSKGLVDNL